jgi:hypothetical protein
MRSRQLNFVFADSPRGSKGARATDESAVKAYLLHRAKDMPTSDLIAPAADTSRRGVWYKSNTRGMTAAYPNAWFHERLVSLWTSWEQFKYPPKRASSQTLLFER